MVGIPFIVCQHWSDTNAIKVSPTPWPTSDWESRLSTLISALVTLCFTWYDIVLFMVEYGRWCWTIGGGCCRCHAVQRSSSRHVYQPSRSQALFWRNTGWYVYLDKRCMHQLNFIVCRNVTSACLWRFLTTYDLGSILSRLCHSTSTCPCYDSSILWAQLVWYLVYWSIERMYSFIQAM